MSPSPPLTVGTIGAGNFAQTIARHALAAGHRAVLSNSRGPDTLTEVIERLGEDASAGTVVEATQSDVVFLCVGWDQVDGALAGLPAWQGQIVVDTTNQWHNHDPEQPADLGDETGSEHIAAKLPGAHVVKAFNTVFMKVLGGRGRLGQGSLVIFLAGDDDQAKATVSGFVESVDLEPVDLGPLREGGRPMQGDGPLVALHVEKIA